MATRYAVLDYEAAPPNDVLCGANDLAALHAALGGFPAVAGGEPARVLAAARAFRDHHRTLTPGVCACPVRLGAWSRRNEELRAALFAALDARGEAPRYVRPAFVPDPPPEAEDSAVVKLGEKFDLGGEA